MTYRIAGFFLALFSAGLAPAQSSVWQNVATSSDSPPINLLTLTRKQRTSVRSVLSARYPKAGPWECDDRSWLKNLQFYSLPAASHAVLLIEAGVGCARGGQGANGAMWLVVWRNGHPHVVASAEAQFDGWLYSVQPQSHHGLHDIVLGWHMSAAEAGLTYFEFDGASFKAVSSAMLQSDEGGNNKIIPASQPSK